MAGAVAERGAITAISAHYEQASWQKPEVRIPLDFVPSPEKRQGIPSELIHTASHELNHALVAMNLGVAVHSVSVEPEGFSLGRTILAGSFSMDTFKTIATAGSVATHDGEARGFGSDMFKAQYLSHFYGGITPDVARMRAQGIISEYPKEVREKAAEIIAYLGVVSGSMLPDIIRRAELEVEGKISNNHAGYLRPEDTIPKMDKGRFTSIEDLDDDRFAVRVIVDGQERKNETFCSYCFMRDGHVEDCPALAKEEDNKDVFINGKDIAKFYSPDQGNGKFARKISKNNHIERDILHGEVQVDDLLKDTIYVSL